MRNLTKREVLERIAAAAAGFSLAGYPPALAEEGTVKAIARRKGLHFGSEVHAGFETETSASFEDASYRALLLRECDTIVPGNEMKWNRIARYSATPDFSTMDAIVDFGSRSGLAIRGHTLLWQIERRMPPWVTNFDFGKTPRQSATDLIDTHIMAVCQRYGTRILSYDVVNEAIDNKTGALRETSLSQAMGGAEALIDHAFRTASKAAPHAELVYNDFMGWSPDSQVHRQAVLDLLRGFRDRNVPVTTLGIQSHLYSGREGAGNLRAIADIPEWHRFLNEVTSMGYRLIISELDVNDRRLTGPVRVQDEISAKLVETYLSLMLDYRQTHTVIAWGMSDKYTWLRSVGEKDDHLPRRASPYDDQERPKPMLQAIKNAFAAAPAR